MSGRERVLAMVILSLVVVAGGGLLFYQFLLGPVRRGQAAVAAVKVDIDRKRQRIAELNAERVKLARWRLLSLPPDMDLARREYEKYLSDLLRQSGFAAGSFSVTPKPADNKTSPTLPGKKEPVYTRLTFTVLAHADLASLVSLLDRFYRTPLLHQIRNIAVQRPLTIGPQQRQDELDINLTVEALIVGGSANRMTLLPEIDAGLLRLEVLTGLRGGPTGFALIPWAAGPTGPLGPGNLASPPRQYAAIANRDVFFGPPSSPAASRDDTDTTQFVYLTDITRNGERAEAFLYDRYNNRRTRLRLSAGFSSFVIRDAQGEPVVRGTVLRIDDRDVIFRANDKYYALHVGQSLKEAMREPLKEEGLKARGMSVTKP